jgi:DNA-binding MarR family transcriptional regulator
MFINTINYVIVMNTNAQDDGVFARLNYGAAPSKVLDFFIENKNDMYSQTEVAEDTNLSNKTAFLAIKHLEKRGLIKLERKIGSANMYRLNLGSAAAKALVKAAFEISSIEANELIKEQEQSERKLLTV